MYFVRGARLCIFNDYGSILLCETEPIMDLPISEAFNKVSYMKIYFRSLYIETSTVFSVILFTLALFFIPSMAIDMGNSKLEKFHHSRVQ